MTQGQRVDVSALGIPEAGVDRLDAAAEALRPSAVDRAAVMAAVRIEDSVQRTIADMSLGD